MQGAPVRPVVWQWLPLRQTCCQEVRTAIQVRSSHGVRNIVDAFTQKGVAIKLTRHIWMTLNMRICIMTGASHALGMGSCTKAIWRCRPPVIYTWSRCQSFSFSKSTSSRPPVIYLRSQSYSFMWLAPFSSTRSLLQETGSFGTLHSRPKQCKHLLDFLKSLLESPGNLFS